MSIPTDARNASGFSGGDEVPIAQIPSKKGRRGVPFCSGPSGSATTVSDETLSYFVAGRASKVSRAVLLASLNTSC